MRFGCCSLSVPGLRSGCIAIRNSRLMLYPILPIPKSRLILKPRVLLRLKSNSGLPIPLKMPWLAFRIWSLPVPYPVMDSLKSPLSLKMGLIFIGPVSRLTNGYRRRNLSCLHKSHRRCPPFLRVSVRFINGY